MSNDTLYIASSYFKDGSLFSFLKKKRLEKQLLSEKIKWKLAVSAIIALYELHQANIVHRDFKSANLLIKVFNYELVLCDLATAKQMENFVASKTCGTLRWLSPESIDSNEFTFASDVFSLGTVLWEIFSGAEPFSRGTYASIVNSIKSGNVQEIQDSWDERIKHLIKWCWKVEPSQRPSTVQMLQYIIESFQEGEISKFFANVRKYGINRITLVVRIQNYCFH